MTRDDIIRMAREAGCEIRNGHIYHQFSLDQMLKRFTALVASAEREACAKILDRNAEACVNNSMLRDVLMGNALAIRARGSHGDAAKQAEPVQEQVTYSTGGFQLEAGFYSADQLREMLKALESMNAAARRAMKETT